MRRGTQPDMRIIVSLLVIVVLFTVSCVGLQSMNEIDNDPRRSIDMEYRMDTPGKRAYWNQTKENNNSGLIIIDDTKNK